MGGIAGDGGQPVTPGPGPGHPSGMCRLAGGRWLFRIEDWLLAGWVALVAPAIIHVGASSPDPFDPGRPVDGVLGLVAIFGAAACLATRSANSSQGAGLYASTAVGPFVGGLLLIIATTAVSLGLSGAVVALTAVVVVAVAVVVRARWPRPPAMVRRALVTPYLLVAGGLFWSLIGAVTAGGDVPARIRSVGASDPGSVVPIVGFLLALSAVYYSMLIYAPRQVAEHESGPIAWLVRYGLFVASVVFGAGWLLILAG
jgi:hypothetical protein